MAAKKLAKKSQKPPKVEKVGLKAELAVREFESAAAFERWLGAQHAKSPGIWLRLMKKASGQPGVTYAEALEIALAFGWIDGQTKTYDAVSWLRKFVPRG